jgi:hypothetical protein
VLQDTTKLVRDLPDVRIPSVQESIEAVFTRMRAGLVAAGKFPPPPAKAPRIAGAPSCG